MFRRKSSSRHQPLNTTPSASAQSAATRAFIASRDASPSLSSAAAAAALRSHTPPPTTPGNVQTKRMLQRQLSNSYRGSSSGGLRHGSQPTLRRTPSSGSMTSRTFREPSPGRPATGSSNNTSFHPPPVPPIPRQVSNRTMPPRRSASAQPNSGAPPNTKSGTARVASLDRTPSDITASPASPRSSFAKGNSLEMERPGSRTSVNFSYPISARPNSPPQSPVQHEMNRNSIEQSPSPTLSPAETASIQRSVSSAGNRKVKTRPQTAAPGSIEGSHFAHKTMGSRPTGTALQDEPGNYEQEEPLQPEAQKSTGVSVTESTPSQSAPLAEESTHSPVALERDNVQPPDDENIRPQPKKRPSMVMEDNEGEELAEAADAVRGEVTETSVVHNKPHSPEPSKAQPTRQTPFIHPLQTAQPQATVHPQALLSPSTSSTPSSPGDRQLPERQPSISPNRSARFSSQLTVSSNSPLHEPPPRSISPVKPALKNSTSPDRRIQLGRPPSEFSDGTSVASDEGSRTGSKKKVAKVSFDDEAEVVGVAASPPTSPEPMNRSLSPVEKPKSKKWFGISVKKGATKDVAEDDEFESVLRPRPALPFFGSIRGIREPDDAVTTPANDDESDMSSDDDVQSPGLGISSDHAIGSILVNAHQHDVRGSIQQHQAKERSHPKVESPTVAHEDTTPEVPIESRIPDGVIVHHNLPTVHEEQSTTPPAETSPVRISDVAADTTANQNDADRLKEPVPTIAIQPATPGEDQRRSIDLRDMPGGFPSYIPERPTPKTQQNSTSPIESSVQTPEEAGSDDDSGESIYSDAAEDPADFQGDLFGSINAIVDSPVPTETQLPKEVPDSPTRTSRRSGPLAKVTESIPSPSLEAINPRMPATPSPSQDPVIASSLPAASSQQQQSSDPADSSWPLKSVVESSVDSSAAVQPRSKHTPPNPHQGSHLRNSLKKTDGQQQQQQLRQSVNKASSSSTLARPKRAPTASTAEIRGNAPPRRQAGAKPLPQSMTYPAGLTKIKSNDSDSDSSFKRSRRSSRSGAGRQFAMKRTMRASTSNAETIVERSTSPRTSSIRTTMREAPTDRSSGFGSSRDKSLRSRPRSSVISSNSRSRFGDSDDENGVGGRRLFQSRFADSSDEDEPSMNNLTPVRGIPRRQGKYDGESTDLDDSSDDETKRQIRNSAVKASQQMTPDEIDKILSQPKKKGLLARLVSPTRSSGKEGKVLKSRMDSPARRDTPLERSRQELARMRETTNGHEVDTRPISPKLQKKQRSAFNDTWPLSSDQTATMLARPKHTTNATQVRPSTSDGIVNGSNAKDRIDGNGLRPLINRHGTSDSIDSRVTSTASEVVVGRTGKKKRFPLLRKAFGLRD